MGDGRLPVRGSDQGPVGFQPAEYRGIRADEGTAPQHDAEPHVVQFIHQPLGVREACRIKLPIAVGAAPAVIDHQYPCGVAVREDFLRIAQDLFLRTVPLHLNPGIVLRDGKHIRRRHLPDAGFIGEAITHGQIGVFQRVSALLDGDVFSLRRYPVLPEIIEKGTVGIHEPTAVGEQRRGRLIACVPHPQITGKAAGIRHENTVVDGTAEKMFVR